MKKEVIFVCIILGIVFISSTSYAISPNDLEILPVGKIKGVKLYSIKNDLSNISNLKSFKFGNKSKGLLAKNAFCINAKYSSSEFFPIYEENRYNEVPNFVTTDSVLHNYHLFFDYLLKTTETNYLSMQLKELSRLMLEISKKQYNTLKGTSWEKSAKRNIAYFSVALKLLDEKFKILGEASKIANKELEYIKAQSGISYSPIMDGKLNEDYTQYKPRGHYTKSETLKKYFQAMMWYGRIMFLIEDVDFTKSGILMVMALRENKNILALWNSIYDVTCFFVGKSDDLSYYDYNPLLEKIYGKNINLKNLKEDKYDIKTLLFIGDAKKLRLSMIKTLIDPGKEKTGEPAGFRFMGKRFVLDSAMFQQLIYAKVGTANKPRVLPKGIDIPAVFGSDEALNILTEMGETKYLNYSKNMALLRTYIQNMKEQDWHVNLYFLWLKALKLSIMQKGKEYPAFMQNNAWKKKELNTFMGSWTELKHDTLLYAGECTAEGEGPEEFANYGYVEPNPYFYSIMKALVSVTRNGLKKLNILDKDMEANLIKMEEVVLKLKTISEKELNEQDLTKEEYNFIRDYGMTLEDFWLETLKDDPEGDTSGKLLRNPAAVVADVATNPEGEVLEEAVGRIFNILVVVPVKGKLVITSGGVYTYYEFTKPISERMTDEQWRENVMSGDIPEQPSWIKPFIVGDISLK